MKHHVYVGTYMDAGGEGICLLELDTEAGTLIPLASWPELSRDPSFLSVEGDFLYAVSEGMDHGTVTAFRRDRKTGYITYLNHRDTEGTAMCHLLRWKDKPILSAANYGSGSLLTLRLAPDGSVGDIQDFLQHTGVGFDAAGRQEGPHVHSTGLTPDGTKLFAADLGLDRVVCYEVAEDGTLTPGPETAQITVPGGEGPRHFVFSADGSFLYLATEMGSKVFVFTSQDGWVTHRCLQSVSALPEDFTGESYGADIHLSPDGNFLYMSNRGKDCITAFRVTPEGTLETLGYYDCGGTFPRNFCVTPEGDCLLIANQHSGTLALCPRDPKTGTLAPPTVRLSIPQAVFVTTVEVGN